MEPRTHLSPSRRLRPLQFPALIFTIFWILALVLWRRTGNPFFIFDMGNIGTSLGIGIGLYELLPRHKKPVGRRLAQFLVGIYMVGFLGLIVLQNMQLEGLLFFVFTGIFSGAVIHYSIAKIFGPMIFGRGFCGWACWTAMVIDLLPYDRSKGWVPGPWRWLRYVHFLLSVGLVGSLVIVFGYRLSHWTPLWWLLAGNMLYYAAAIPMAILLKDNRAFCKYLCPVAVLMKLGSRFSPLKIGGVRERCDSCMACVKMCPMDIRIPDYVQAGKRVLSTECILCQTCASVCPTSALSVTWGFDVGWRERLQQRASDSTVTQ
ncbi:MAG: 4Fe-4S binding protein [Candidatus Sulfotelmatobacter sp.]